MPRISRRCIRMTYDIGVSWTFARRVSRWFVTHSIGQVDDQVVDGKIPNFEFAVQPFGKGLLLDIHPEV